MEELKQIRQQEVEHLKQKAEKGYLHINYFLGGTENEKRYWAALSRISVTTENTISGSFIVCDNIPASVEEKWKIQGYLKLASEKGLDKIPEECPYEFFQITATSERRNCKYGEGFLRLYTIPTPLSTRLLCQESKFYCDSFDSFIIIREVGIPSPVYTLRRT